MKSYRQDKQNNFLHNLKFRVAKRLNVVPITAISDDDEILRYKDLVNTHRCTRPADSVCLRSYR